jgi:hypothetical protein
MMFGTYRQQEMPRVVHLSVSRYSRALPRAGETLEFLVSIHEEGTGFTWQQNVTVDPATEAFLVQATHDLHLWSLNLAHTPKKAADLADQVGRTLYDTFLGVEGHRVLDTIPPTAILLNVDETILNLPWELIATEHDVLSQRVPLGRLVTTRFLPRPGRDPLQEDAVVRILAVANPTLDLPATERTIEALRDLAGNHGPFTVEVDVLSHQEATRARFAQALAAGDYDILHFAGHAFLHPDTPGVSALRFADGDLAADEVLDLPWKKPPYFVFNSACESGRAAGGLRLVSDESHSNGLAAAFLAAGVYGYAGYFWPVTDAGAGILARTFYEALFTLENVGLAFLEARRHVWSELEEVGDLAAYGAILFGDAASQHRRDLAMAV